MSVDQMSPGPYSASLNGNLTHDLHWILISRQQHIQAV